MEQQHEAPKALGLRYVLRSLVYRFGADRVTDLAAATTYYLVLSVFPLLLAVVCVLSLLGGAAWVVPHMEDLVGAFLTPDAAQAFGDIAARFLASEGAGVTLGISTIAALWSASGYIGAFTRAVNAVYRVAEGRNFFKLKGIQVLMTLSLVLLIILLVVALAVSSPAAFWLGDQVGLGEQFATFWAWLRYPLLGVAVVILVRMLFFSAPNVKQPHIRVLSAGSLVAIVLAVGAIEVFRVYLSVFNGASNYAKTYGALAGVIIVLLLLFFVNIALLIGAELDAALERLHQLRLGLPAESGLLLPPRDETGIKSRAATRARLVETAHVIRMNALAGGATAPAWYEAAQLDIARDESLETDSPPRLAKPGRRIGRRRRRGQGAAQ